MTEFKWVGDFSTGGSSGGSPYWIDPVATASALPATAPEGTMVLVIDEDALYERRGFAWVLFVDPGALDARLDMDEFNLAAHVTDTNNPHAVTKAQVGLGNVENAAASTLYIPLTQRAAPNGVATLDAGGLIPSSQLPPIAITDTFVVSSQAAQTALTAQVGDVAVRTDLNKSYILRVEPASVFANWQELLTPTDAVLSVNGQTGAVNLTTTNIAEGTNLYYTDERAQDAVGNALVDSASVDFTYNDAANQITAAVIPAGVDRNALGGGALSIANGGTGATNATTARDNLSPLTTKGDIWVYGAGNTRLPVGLNGYAVVANSATATGLDYAAVLSNPMTTLGDIIYGGSGGTATRLAGNTTTTRQVLTQTGTGTASAAPVWGDDLASATENGRVSTGTQTLAGNKTLTGTTTIGPVAGGVAHSIRGSIDFTAGNNAGAPSYGINRNAANGIDIYANSTKFLQISSSGVHTIGNATVNQHVINGGGATNNGVNIVSQQAGDSARASLVCTKVDNDNSGNQTFILFQINAGAANSGKISANGPNAAQLASTSDARVKENIVDLTPQLDKLMSLRPVEFDYIEIPGHVSPGHQIGFIAQEMEQVYPDSVQHEDAANPYKSIVGWSKTEAILVKAIQELKAENDALKTRLEALERV